MAVEVTGLAVHGVPHPLTDRLFGLLRDLVACHARSPVPCRLVTVATYLPLRAGELGVYLRPEAASSAAVTQAAVLPSSRRGDLAHALLQRLDAAWRHLPTLPVLAAGLDGERIAAFLRPLLPLAPGIPPIDAREQLACRAETTRYLAPLDYVDAIDTGMAGASLCLETGRDYAANYGDGLRLFPPGWEVVAHGMRATVTPAHLRFAADPGFATLHLDCDLLPAAEVVVLVDDLPVTPRVTSAGDATRLSCPIPPPTSDDALRTVTIEVMCAAPITVRSYSIDRKLVGRPAPLAFDPAPALRAAGFAVAAVAAPSPALHLRLEPVAEEPAACRPEPAAGHRTRFLIDTGHSEACEAHFATDGWPDLPRLRFASIALADVDGSEAVFAQADWIAAHLSHRGALMGSEASPEAVVRVIARLAAACRTPLSVSLVGNLWSARRAAAEFC